MTVQRLVCGGHVYEVGGVGYAPVGTVSLDGRHADASTNAALEMAVRTGLLCNDAALREDEGEWLVDGDPTEGALLVLARKAGLAGGPAQPSWPRLDAIPFESEHRLMATWHRDPHGAPWILVKGAPERVIDLCATERRVHGERPIDVDWWRRMATDTAAQGLRVLALALQGRRTGRCPPGVGRHRATAIPCSDWWASSTRPARRPCTPCASATTPASA